jgi:FAD/FMN-containing dehydrogenase
VPGRVPLDATAFAHRRLVDALHIFPGWSDSKEDEAIMAWARGLYEKLEPFAEGGVYVNMLAEDEEDRIPAAYRHNYARLVALKKEWDPDNLFRRNHNIRPAG